LKHSIALCGGVSLLAITSAAFAQEQPNAAPSAPAAQGGGPPQAQAPAALDVITITGSRIVRNGYNAPTPVTVAPVAQLEATTPSNIADGLNKLPEFAGSTTQASNANNGTSVSGNFLNLRSFGVIRTLVLLDGQRVPATDYNGQVDVNTLPQMLVQRVDVVTGGASAVYGSDAVTGVVNFVLDTKFNGLKAVAQTGVSTYGDAPSNRIGVAGGGSLGDKAHFIWSAERYSQAGLSENDRTFGAADPVYTGAGTAASPYQLIYNDRTNNQTYGGLVTSGPFAGQQFASNGQLAPFVHGGQTASPFIAEIGGDGAYYHGMTLYTPLETDKGFARFDYEFTDNFSGYVQAGLSRSLITDKGGAWPFGDLTMYSGNPFLPTSAQNQLTASNMPSFTMNELPQNLILQSTTTEATTAIDVTAGLKGKLGSNFVWSAYYTYGEGRMRNDTTDNINFPRFYAALDAVTGPGGAPVCNVTLTNPGLYPGCQPLNFFGQGNASRAALKYIYGETTWQAVNKSHDVAASISGALFNDWAGPVSVASNVEYRYQSLTETTNANPNIPANFTGIRLGSPDDGSLPWAYATTAPQHGSDSVWEISGETVVPLARDMTLIKSLEVNGAVRYTHYSSSGGATTWKIGLNYNPVADVRFRVTESRDIRAPTLYDLYSGASVASDAISDSHTGVSNVTASETIGNPHLVPEVAQTTTVGVVYSPSWFHGFRISVDYYNITINNAIEQLSSAYGSLQGIVDACNASGGTASVCADVIRPFPYSNTSGGNFPTEVINATANIAQNYTHGLDVEASYALNLADVLPSAQGTVNWRLLYNYQPVNASRAAPGAPVINAAGYSGLPSSRVTLTTSYQNGPLEADWLLRYSGSEKQGLGVPGQYFAGGPLPGIFYSDVNLAYRFKAAGHNLQAFITINNLFNQQPRVAPLTEVLFIPGVVPPGAAGDDVLGRYFTGGFRFSF
jgi:iron complex outermembrane receptor protein